MEVKRDFAFKIKDALLKDEKKVFESVQTSNREFLWNRTK